MEIHPSHLEVLLATTTNRSSGKGGEKFLTKLRKNLGDFLISDFYPSKFLKALFSHLPIFNDFYPWRSKAGPNSLYKTAFTPLFSS